VPDADRDRVTVWLFFLKRHRPQIDGTQIPARGRFADMEMNEVFRRLVENERDILRLALDTLEGLKMTYPKTSATAGRNCS
jgi:hypothetical protein